MSFDAAWRAFAQDDARIKAPARLEQRLLDALKSPPMERPRHIGYVLPAASVAAAAVVIGAVWPRSTAPILPRGLESRTIITDSSVPLKAHVTPSPPARRLIDPPPRNAVQTSPTRSNFAEAFQVVRLRIPREALETLGLMMFEPDTRAAVDVDVLIGEDGLPLGIRYVQTGVAP